MTEPQQPRGATPAHLTSEELSECAFSPETAATGLLEHTEGCARCSAELADLRLLLTELAALPEPELPETVAIRMDAAVARAWQEADAGHEEQAEAARSAAAATKARRGRRLSWPKIAIPLGALSLIALAAVGIGALVAHQGTSNSASAGAPSVASAQAPQGYGQLTETSLAAWVHSILPSAGAATNSSNISPHANVPNCVNPEPPKRSGYTILTSSRRELDGQQAMLVVYQNAQEPASPTVYAVVYAGSCPSSTSRILAEGSVSR